MSRSASVRGRVEMAGSESGALVWCAGQPGVIEWVRFWDLPVGGRGVHGERRVGGRGRDGSGARGGRRGAAPAHPRRRRLVRGLRGAVGTAGVLRAMHAGPVGTRGPRRVRQAVVARWRRPPGTASMRDDLGRVVLPLAPGTALCLACPWVPWPWLD